MQLFDCQCGLIGDALASVPFMLHLHERHHGPSMIGPDFSQWVYDGIEWPTMIRKITNPDIFADIKTIKVIPKQAWQWSHGNGWPCHMAEAHFHTAKMQVVNPFKIPLKRDRHEFYAEIVIAPFSMTNLPDNNKKWPESHWSQLIAWCISNGLGVVVLGSDQDDAEPYVAAGALPFQGRPMAAVVDMLAKCACFVSVDTGIGHLAVMMNMKNHVMIYGNCVPPKFAETPFGVNVRGPYPKDISAMAVISEVRKTLDTALHARNMEFV